MESCKPQVDPALRSHLAEKFGTSLYHDASGHVHWQLPEYSPYNLCAVDLKPQTELKMRRTTDHRYTIDLVVQMIMVHSYTFIFTVFLSLLFSPLYYLHR